MKPRLRPPASRADPSTPACGARHRLDAYQTPPALARAAVAALVGVYRREGSHLRVVLEPHAGQGAFVRALLGYHARVVAIDLDPQAPGLALAADGYAGADFRTWTPDPGDVPDLVVGNPPYNDPEGGTAQEHVIHALSVVRMGGRVAFVLPLGFLGSQRRMRFWADHPCEWVSVLVPRPSFTGTGTDGTDYGLFVWRRSSVPGATQTRLGHLVGSW